jgi:glucose/arabinose dehydrogenase
MTGLTPLARRRMPFSALQQSAGVLGAVVIALMSVGGASSAQDPGGGPGPGTTTVSGGERLTWDQVAPSETEVRTYRYVAYIDGEPVDLSGVTCSRAAVSDAGFVCSAPLPPLTPGQHDIAVSAYVNQVDRLATYQSWPIRVYLRVPANNASISALSGGSRDSSLATSDGVQLHSTLVTTALDDPTELVTLPDGRVLIAERAGRVRMLRGGSLMRSPALSLTDVSTVGGGGLLSLMADREFDRTRAVYALYTTAEGLRLSRFIESNDTLSSGAVLLDGLPVSAIEPAATLSIGADGRIYIGLDNGGEAQNDGDLGPYSGKVLRVNKDATTPSDQLSRNPIFTVGLDHPAGMGWSANGSLWLLGTDERRSHQLLAFPAGADVASADATRRYVFPSGVAATSMAIYPGRAATPLRDNLFVTDSASGSLLRIRFDSTNTVNETEWMFRGKLHSARRIAISPDGSIYVATSDGLFRVSAER